MWQIEDIVNTLRRINELPKLCKIYAAVPSMHEVEIKRTNDELNMGYYYFSNNLLSFYCLTIS